MVNKINKAYILNYICNSVIDALNDNKIIDYNYIKSLLYDNNSIVDYLNNKKNVSVYINNLLKYDASVKRALFSHNIEITTNGNYQYCSSEPQQISLIKTYNISSLDYFCPYMELIISTKQAAKVSNKLSKTNELVLNHDLTNSLEMSRFVKYITNIIDNVSIKRYKNSYILTYNNKVTTLNIGAKSIDLKLDSELKKELSICKKLYPFKFYIYYNISTILYILNCKGYTVDANYVTIKLLDITIDAISRKYFQEDNDTSYKIITNLYDIFYKDKIQSSVFEDYSLVKKFYNIFNANENKNYINFMVGQYKLYIYLKNKYNREIKNVALELYDNNNRNVINKIIGFNDTTGFSQDVFNSEIISTEEILI